MVILQGGFKTGCHCGHLQLGMSNSVLSNPTLSQTKCATTVALAFIVQLIFSRVLFGKEDIAALRFP